jgi:hypothetical protein
VVFWVRDKEIILRGTQDGECEPIPALPAGHAGPLARHIQHTGVQGVPLGLCLELCRAGGVLGAGGAVFKAPVAHTREILLDPVVRRSIHISGLPLHQCILLKRSLTKRCTLMFSRLRCALSKNASGYRLCGVLMLGFS